MIVPSLEVLSFSDSLLLLHRGWFVSLVFLKLKLKLTLTTTRSFSFCFSFKFRFRLLASASNLALALKLKHTNSQLNNSRSYSLTIFLSISSVSISLSFVLSIISYAFFSSFALAPSAHYKLPPADSKKHMCGVIFRLNLEPTA